MESGKGLSPDRTPLLLYSITPAFRRGAETENAPSVLRINEGRKRRQHSSAVPPSFPANICDRALESRDNGRTRAALLLRSGSRLRGDVRRGADEESFQPVALPLWRRGARLLFPFVAKTWLCRHSIILPTVVQLAA